MRFRASSANGGKRVPDRLVREDVTIGEEQDARAAPGFAGAPPIGEVPAAVEQLPRNLECDVRLARAGRERQQDAIAALGDCAKRFLDRVDLIIVRRLGAALVLERHGGEAVAPERGARLGGAERLLPQRVGAGVAVEIGLRTGRHVDAVKLFPVAGEGEAGLQFLGVALGLAEPLGGSLVARFRLQHREALAAMGEHVVGDLRLGPPTRALQPPEGDPHLPPHPALPRPPAGGGKCGVDQLRAGLRLVHAAIALPAVSSPEKARASRDCLNSARTASLRRTAPVNSSTSAWTCLKRVTVVSCTSLAGTCIGKG